MPSVRIHSHVTVAALAISAAFATFSQANAQSAVDFWQQELRHQGQQFEPSRPRPRWDRGHDFWQQELWLRRRPFDANTSGDDRGTVDFTKAPPPRKADSQSRDTILVLGDSMADWLGYGLEEVLSDAPELGIVRNSRAASGLIRHGSRNISQDWPQVSREAIAATKPKFVVMMLGLNDRHVIRGHSLPSKPSLASSEQTDSSALAAIIADEARNSILPDTARPESPSATTPGRPARGRNDLQTFAFRSEQWEEHYVRAIDATIAALKSGGIPVLWVGLPSIRGSRSTSDMLYFNGLFRAHAEKAGITYVDVWDGFVDENGRHVTFGPDVEGQTRRLRTSDGVHFTKAGARKLAHFVEREIRRVLIRGVMPIALPASKPEPQSPDGQPSKSRTRPLAGPVLPLTAMPMGMQELLGGNNPTIDIRQPLAIRTLVNGRPLTPAAGRSDDFKWPRRSIAPFGTDPVVVTTTDPLPVMLTAPATSVPMPKAEDRPIATTSSRQTSNANPRSRYNTLPHKRDSERRYTLPYFLR